MADLEDYSRDFNPELELRDFSKDALVRLWQAGGRIYVGNINFWYSLVRERFGEQAAKEMQNVVQMGGGLNELELRRVRGAMNIHGDAVADLFKHFQVDPGAAGFIDFGYELRSRYHGIATCKRCWALDYFERSGDTSYGQHMCLMDVWGFSEAATIFNKDMKTMCLKLPPRKTKDEIACQWLFKMRSTDSHFEPAVRGAPGLVNTATGELEDYSGDFKPDLRLQEFSKDALVRVCRAAGMLYVGLDGIHYSWAKELWGQDKAAELDAEVWRRAAHVDVRRAKQVMNIEGTDVATLFKIYQVDPGMFGKLDASYELTNNAHGVLTVNRCRTLEYLRRHGDDFRQKHVCEVVDVDGFARTARVINRDIRVTPLRLPSQGVKGGVACQWEFSI